MDWVLTHTGDVLNVVSLALNLALAVAALTPTDADDTAIGRVKNIFDKVRSVLPFLGR